MLCPDMLRGSLAQKRNHCNCGTRLREKSLLWIRSTGGDLLVNMSVDLDNCGGKRSTTHADKKKDFENIDHPAFADMAS